MCFKTGFLFGFVLTFMEKNYLCGDLGVLFLKLKRESGENILEAFNPNV